MNLNQDKFKRRLQEMVLKKYDKDLRTVAKKAAKRSYRDRANRFEELYSVALVAAWKGLDRYDPSRSPLRTWLWNCAQFDILDYMREESGVRIWVEAGVRLKRAGSLSAHLRCTKTQEPGGGRVGHKIDPMQLVPAESRPLVKAIYYDYLTQVELAESMGVGQSIVSYLHTQALDHARYMAEGLK